MSLILVLAAGIALVILESDSENAEADNLSVSSADTNAASNTVNEAARKHNLTQALIPLAILFVIAIIIARQKN